MALGNKDKTNIELGKQVEAKLRELGIQTPTTDFVNGSDDAKVEMITEHLTKCMEIMGLDLSDDSLQDTPRRVAKMWVKELFAGLKPDRFPKCTTVENKFAHEGEFVLVKNIRVKSTCEHHFLPYSDMFGSDLLGCNIAYIPNEKVLGLSKLNRVVEYFSRRPQVQERHTAQICAALQEILGTEDVIVHMHSAHTCVSMRGVEDENSSTVTVSAGGVFAGKQSELRKEFMSNVNR